MILLKIKKPVSYKPIKWEAADLTGLQEGQSFVRYMGNHPNNPEYGSVEISVGIMEGNFNGITELLFINEDETKCALTRWKKGYFGNYIIEIAFNTVFGHGLKYSTQNLILQGGAIIGLSDEDKKRLDDFSGQRELLSMLTKYVIPTKRKEILHFAKPSLLCVPNDGSDENCSHFLGRPKHHPDAYSTPEGTNPLFPLATILADDIKELIPDVHIDKFLSFYLRINDTHKKWPTKRDDFKVYNHNDVHDSDSTNQTYFEAASNYKTKRWLDLPDWNHSILHFLKFSEDEKQRYNALSTVYKQLVLKGFYSGEVNKLLGYPDTIQNCVAYEAEIAFNLRAYSDAIYTDAVNWLLLLQISPYCKKFKFFDEFGDGTIYFMIKEADLRNGNFEHCQVIVQNT